MQIAHRIQHGQVLGIMFQNFFVLGDRILQLTLLDTLLRSAEDFLFVETETKRHKIADSSSVLSGFTGKTNDHPVGDTWSNPGMAIRTWSFYGSTARIVWLLRVTGRECTSG